MDLDCELAAIARRDVEAFGRWIAGAEPELRRSLRPFAARVDPEAVLQKTFLRVWLVAPKFQPDGRNGLLRLAVRTAMNLVKSELRRQRLPEVEWNIEEVERSTSLLGQEGHSPRSWGDPFLRQAIRDCHQKLTGKPAEALAMRLTAAGSEPDLKLAGRLGMTLNTFLQNFTRARRLLAQCLEKRGVDLGAELR